MKRNLVPIFAQSTFTLMVFATITNAQTVSPLPATQPAEALSSREIAQSAVDSVTRDSSAPAAGLLVVRANDRWRFDLRNGKMKTAKSTPHRQVEEVYSLAIAMELCS